MLRLRSHIFTHTVLNASHCTLPAVPSGLSALHTLKALVLSHNDIADLGSSFPHLPELNTLVLSHNQLRSLPATLPTSLPRLKKLSLGHNRLTCDGLPDFSVCSHLREVRLSGNTSIHHLPTHVSQWGRGVDGGAPGLVLLDVSECGIDHWDGMRSLCKEDSTANTERHGLVNLCAKGNGISSPEDAYHERLREWIPSLRILDNVRLDVPKTATSPALEVQPPKKVSETSSAPPSSTPSLPRSRNPGKSNTDSNIMDSASHSKHSVSQRTPKRKAAATEVNASSSPLSTVPDDGSHVPKKVRKRSGRGPKKRDVKVREHAMESVPAEVLPSNADSMRGDDNNQRFQSAKLSASDEAPAIRHKKTRRKKSTKKIEMDMETAPTRSKVLSNPAKEVRERASPLVESQKDKTVTATATAARPPPSSPPSSPPPSAQAPSGVVQVVQVQRPRAPTSPSASASALLGRRQDDLHGW